MDVNCGRRNLLIHAELPLEYVRVCACIEFHEVAMHACVRAHNDITRVFLVSGRFIVGFARARQSAMHHFSIYAQSPLVCVSLIRYAVS